MVRSGDIYFSLGMVLTLNVKSGEDLKINLKWKKVPMVPCQVCFYQTYRFKVRSKASFIGLKRVKIQKIFSC